MNTYLIDYADSESFDEIIQLWEASVRATHHFLSEEDILFYRSLLLNNYLKAVDLYKIYNEAKKIVAFLGVNERHIEMLFIHPGERGKGLGKQLIHFSIDKLHCNAVDVNEQNTQAVGFYLKMGFEVTSRDEKDGCGKPFPILHMKLSKPTTYYQSELECPEKPL